MKTGYGKAFAQAREIESQDNAAQWRIVCTESQRRLKALMVRALVRDPGNSSRH